MSDGSKSALREVAISEFHAELFSRDLIFLGRADGSLTMRSSGMPIVDFRL
jgi:hypothetical protein